MNYVLGVVRILETPKQKMLKNQILLTKLRAQFPQLRTTRMVTLVFWGNLAHDVAMYYKTNDYLIIEGYVSLRDYKDSKLTQYKSKQIQITVLKAYPFLLNYDQSIRKI